MDEKFKTTSQAIRCGFEEKPLSRTKRRSDPAKYKRTFSPYGHHTKRKKQLDCNFSKIGSGKRLSKRKPLPTSQKTKDKQSRCN
jgi:hypothetical protein